MTREEIKDLKNFTFNEKDQKGRRIFANYKDIDPELMERIDYATTEAKKHYDTVFIVHDINQGKHDLTSLHYRGMAIDGHFTWLSLEKMFFFLFLAGFKGIGLYYDWETVGVHADIRQQDVMSVWCKNGDYDYNRKSFLERIGL